MDTIVPFGKYKGKPVEDLIKDTSYLQWLILQPWFTATPLFQIVMNPKEDKDEPTPAHNSMQNRFLDKEFCCNFITRVYPTFFSLDCIPTEQRETWLNIISRNPSDVFQNGVTGYDSIQLSREGPSGLDCVRKGQNGIVNHQIYCHFDPYWEVELKDFEPDGGCDVLLHVKGGRSGIGGDIPSSMLVPPFDTVARSDSGCNLGVFVELKPQLGDDYPCVLRRLKKARMNHGNFDLKNRYAAKHVLYIDSFSSASASRSDLKRIFKLAEIDVIFDDELYM